MRSRQPAARTPRTRSISVPVMLVNAPHEVKKLKDGKLADVAPTLLELMGMPQPAVMDGQSLIAG